MNTVVFVKIDTDLKPKQYLKQIEGLTSEGLKKALPGEFVEFSRPQLKTFTFAYLGERPEKFEVTKGSIKVLMTKCILFLVYKENMGGYFVTRLEVASAF